MDISISLNICTLCAMNKGITWVMRRENAAEPIACCHVPWRRNKTDPPFLRIAVVVVPVVLRSKDKLISEDTFKTVEFQNDVRRVTRREQNKIRIFQLNPKGQSHWQIQVTKSSVISWGPKLFPMSTRVWHSHLPPHASLKIARLTLFQQATRVNISF